MKISFLGTNGWYSTDLGNTICSLIETKDFYIILDAGDGLYKIDQYVKEEKPIYLFLSHLHLDHIIGLHILNKFNFSQGMEIFVFHEYENSLTMIINSPFSLPFSKLPYKVQINHLREGSYNSPFDFKCKLLDHSDPCLGYRFYIGNKIISYCTDTGICKNLKSLVNHADLLITESSFKPGNIDEDWPHLNPEQAANLASSQNVKKLILVHFDASIYLSNEDRQIAEKSAKEIFHNTLVAKDGMVLEIF